MKSDGSIRKYFFNLLVYSIYSSINELLGQKGMEIVWRTGEIAFAEVKSELKIRKEDPIHVAEKVAEYLEKAGYGSKFTVKKTKDNEFIHEIHDGAARPAILKMKKKYGDTAVFPHFSTSLMFAALKDVSNVKARIVHLAVAPSEFGVTRERWILSRIEVPDEER